MNRIAARAVVAALLVAAGICANAATVEAANYMLRAPEPLQAGIASRHGLTIVRVAAGHGVCLVSVPDTVPPGQLAAALLADADVEWFEPNHVVTVHESAGPRPLPAPPAVPVVDRSLIPYFGSQVWAGYARQPAAAGLHVGAAQDRAGGGAGTIAIIDTGIDATHPVLARVVVPGFDFLTDVPGIPAETAISVVSILDGLPPALLNPFTARINPSTVSILDGAGATVAPAFTTYGHGTMVAGLVHLVAPNAQIMPLKVFQPNGSASLFDIVRAIYFAVDHGAKVLNMSFSMLAVSPELMRAVNFAAAHEVLCVASVGNHGLETLTYPAALRSVLGVAAINQLGQPSPFTNYGDSLVKVAAPGEHVVTLYPNGRYAMVSGTSFSAALVSGGAALLLSVAPQISQRSAMTALAGSQMTRIPGLGEGLIDLALAVERAAAWLP